MEHLSHKTKIKLEEKLRSFITLPGMLIHFIEGISETPEEQINLKLTAYALTSQDECLVTFVTNQKIKTVAAIHKCLNITIKEAKKATDEGKIKCNRLLIADLQKSIAESGGEIINIFPM